MRRPPPPPPSAGAFRMCVGRAVAAAPGRKKADAGAAGVCRLYEVAVGRVDGRRGLYVLKVFSCSTVWY